MRKDSTETCVGLGWIFPSLDGAYTLQQKLAPFITKLNTHLRQGSMNLMGNSVKARGMKQLQVWLAAVPSNDVSHQSSKLRWHFFSTNLQVSGTDVSYRPTIARNRGERNRRKLCGPVNLTYYEAFTLVIVNMLRCFIIYIY